MTEEPDGPPAGTPAQDRALRLQLREAQAAQRIKETAASTAAFDEKTAKLKALRLARDAEAESDAERKTT